MRFIIINNNDNNNHYDDSTTVQQSTTKSLTNSINLIIENLQFCLILCM